MARKVMTLGDFRSYVRKLRSSLSGADGAIVRGIHKGCVQALVVIHQAVDQAQPASPRGAVGAVDTGDYKRRWQFQLLPGGGRLFNGHPAAPVIERGRRAGAARPPIGAIEAWARRRLGLSAKEAKSAKFAIANAIAKRGLIGRRVVSNPFTTDRIVRVVMVNVHDEVRAALRRGGY